MAADVLGHHPQVQVKALDLGRWNVSAYAIYESEVLAKYVVINLDEWNTTTPYARPSQRFSLNLPRGVRSAGVKRLAGPGASSVTGMSWGGFSWNYTESGGLGRFGEKQEEVLSSRGGCVDLEIPSTEAVLIELHRR